MAATRRPGLNARLPGMRACWQRYPGVDLTLLVGGYAQRYYLGDAGRAAVGATVGSWREHVLTDLPRPLPSWRTRAWVARRPWFKCELLPALRHRIAALLAPR